jgi:hypothetical protein
MAGRTVPGRVDPSGGGYLSVLSKRESAMTPEPEFPAEAGPAPRPWWRRPVVVVAACVALTSASFSPSLDSNAPVRGAAPTGHSQGIAVDGRIATGADVRSGVRHG